MEFETRIVNGKPSIFYKQEPTKTSHLKKLTTKNQQTKKEIRKSLEVSGEIDMVKPSPRDHKDNNKLTATQQLSLDQVNSLNKKIGANLTKEQLKAILSALQTNDVQNQNQYQNTEPKPAKNQNGFTKSIENLNLSDDDFYSPSRHRANNNSNYHPVAAGAASSILKMNQSDALPSYRPPQIVIASDDEFESNNTKTKQNALSDQQSSKTSLINKKKLKWLQDKEMMQQLNKQEEYDNFKISTQMPKPDSDLTFFQGGMSNYLNTAPNKSGSAPEAPPVLKSTLTLAEKKRLEWQAQRASNDFTSQIKYNSTNDLSKLSNNQGGGISQIFGTSTIQQQNDYETNLLRKSNSLNNLNQLIINDQNDSLNKSQSNEVNHNQQNRYSLMDKKKQKWENDLKDTNDSWNPFGKPGPGAGPNKPRQQQQENTVTQLPPQPPSHTSNNNPKTRKNKESLDEFNRIAQQLAAITAAENKIKNEQNFESQKVQQQTNGYHDQSKVPAAMRTSLMFGDVMYDQDIKRTKELERQKWLQELEEQKRQKLIDSQQKLNETQNQNLTSQRWNLSSLGGGGGGVGNVGANNNSNINNIITNNTMNDPYSNRDIKTTLNGVDPDEKTFGRTRNLLDPAEVEELERKRNKNLQHKREIEAQIAEKKRIKNLEDEVQTLDNLKIENEAKQISTLNQMHNDLKTKQPHYQNFDKILTNQQIGAAAGGAAGGGAGVNGKNKVDHITSILQGDSNNNTDTNNEKTSGRGGAGAGASSNETRAQEIYRKMQEAELAAAEERHRRLLKRLQRGGHDTRNLENKFAEYKTKILASINPNSTNNATNKNTNNSSGAGTNNGFETNRSAFTAMSMMNDHEAKLEKQKQFLEKKLMISNSNNETNHHHQQNDKENNNQVISEQKMQQIFRLLREDTSGLPAELNEESIKMLLKNAGKSEKNYSDSVKQNGVNKKSSKSTSTTTTNQRQEQEQEKNTQMPKKGSKPIWNYKNMQGRVAKTNSMKDPFYQERQAFAEERRRKRLEYHQGLIEKNNKKYKEYIQKQQETKSEDSFSNNDEMSNNDYYSKNNHLPGQRPSVASSMSNVSNSNTINTYNPDEVKVGSNRPPHGESILNLLTKNLASDPIYEEDEDYHNTNSKIMSYQNDKRRDNNNNNNKQNAKILSNGSTSSLDENYSQRGFVPFMRTNEFLDPIHAASPIPPSRESSATKRDREKARQAYFQNMKPADYGTNFSTTYDNDPLFNNGLVRNNPTPRQEQILSQLAALKQSLIQKQREVASSINIDNENDYNMD